jgi:hypothetical protein
VETPATLATNLKKAAKAYYGTAGRAFVKKLAEEMERDP